MTNRSRPGLTVAAAITGAVIFAVVGCSATPTPAASPAGHTASSSAGTSTSSPAGSATSGANAGSSTAAIAATCSTSDPQGECPPYGSQVQGEPYQGIVGTSGEITVGNNVFGPASKSYSQTLHVASPGNWTVTANFPVGTSVRSYPNTGQTQNWISGTSLPAALSTWSSMFSTYSVTLNPHSGTVGEAAYDLWLDDWHNEVMIQTDFAGDNLRPRCDVLHDVVTTQTFGGTDGVPAQRWNLCQFGSELIWQPPTGTNYPSGKVNVMAMLTWLETHGGGKYLPAKPTLTAISFGFEICSTASRDQTFELNNFTFTATPA
jgi:hypothetical protein